MAPGVLEDNQRENLPLLVERASSDIERQLRDSEVVDVKALGVLAANAAVSGVIVAAHSELSHLWWVVLVVLAIDAVLLLWVLWPIKLDAGPDTRQFYEAFVTAPPLEARRQMLSELLDAFDGNAHQLSAKNLRFKVAFALFGVALLGAGVVSLTS